MSTDAVSTSIVNDPNFDDKIQYEPGTEPTEETEETEDPDEETEDPDDCGCSMCCGTHVVVNYAGQERPCDYCACTF